MCDYTLHLVASRPAQLADRLVSTDFAQSITRGFSEMANPKSRSACCRALKSPLTRMSDTTAPSRCSAGPASGSGLPVWVNMDDPQVHHDALEFPGGRIMLVTRLVPGQTATVLQLPASARPQDQGGATAEYGLEMSAGLLEPLA